MTRVHLGILALSAALLPMSKTADAAIAFTTDRSGLRSLTLNGFETIGDPGYQGVFCLYGCDATLRRADGTSYDGGGLPATSSAPAPGQLHQTWPWGAIDVSYTAVGANKLRIAITVANRSADTLTSTGGTVFVLDYPATPIGTDRDGTAPLAQYPRTLDPTRGVPALHIALDRYGALLFQMEGDLTAPITFGRMTGFNSDTRYSFRWKMDAPIAPGTSRTASLSLNIASGKATYASMAKDVARSWAGTYPPRVTAWADRRPISAIFIASSVPHPPTNPRGWFNNDPSVDTTTATGRTAFRTRMLAWFDTVIVIARVIGAQGVMVWDIEGQEQPHAASYVCDPTKLDIVAPEMNTQGPADALPLADEIFTRVRAAGLKVGLCLRPQRFDLNGAVSGDFQPDQPDPDVAIDEKADYAVRRWGASMFYVDSNVHPDYGSPIPAQFLFDRALVRHPGLLFGGEWKDEAYFSNGAPYFATTYGGTTITSPVVRYPYPGAFSMIRVGPGADGTPASAYTAAYRTAIRRGDILMAPGWYVPPETTLVKSLYAAIGARPTVSIATPADRLVAPYRTPVTLTAAAADADGQVAKIEYFDGPTKLGQASGAPYTLVLSALSVRPHAIVAKATDNSGNTSFSAPIQLTITP